MSDKAADKKQEELASEEVNLLLRDALQNAQLLNSELKGYLQDAKKEIVYAADALDQSTVKLEGVMKEQLEILRQKIYLLEAEGGSLRRLPEKIKIILEQAIPIISQDVQKNLLQELETAIKESSTKVRLLTEEVKASITEARKFKV